MTNTCRYCLETCSFGYGKCHCGCGGNTLPAKQTDNRRNSIGKEHQKFIKDHQWVKIHKPIDAKPFKIEGVYCRLIQLSRGLYAIVDESHYEWLMQWKWCALKSKNGFYAARSELVNGKYRTVFMHRRILGLSDNDSRQGDHIDSLNPLDNRSANLRIATHVQNCYNVRRKSSRYLKGVSFNSNSKWMARIKINKKTIYLGQFGSEKEAHDAYLEAARKYFGEFACGGQK